MSISALRRFFTLSPKKQRLHDAYLCIVDAARKPVFYAQWQVPDTLDGRFDIIVLHMFLVLTVCEKNTEFCMELTELFFADMDRSLREMGVGDTGVGIRVKDMAQAFYGRLKAYKSALDNELSLAQALHRNVWREKPVANDVVAHLVDYLRRNYEELCAQPIKEIERGQIYFLG